MSVRGGEEKRQARPILSFGNYFFFFFFLIVATPETRARGALPPTQNHKQTKKMWKIPGDESGQGAEARASLNMRRGEVSISH